MVSNNYNFLNLGTGKKTLKDNKAGVLALYKVCSFQFLSLNKEQ